MENNAKISAIIEEIKTFVEFHLQRVFPRPLALNDQSLIDEAFLKVMRDMRYHFPNVEETVVRDYLIRHTGVTPLFLYRLMKEMDLRQYSEADKYQIHGLLRVLCACEIYWSTEIAEGFHIDHGQGLIIGSRAKIGKGFWVHQGCTVGHKSLSDLGDGPVIGDDVIMYANSSILGAIQVGSKSIIAAHTLVINDIEGQHLWAGVPAKAIKQL